MARAARVAVAAVVACVYAGGTVIFERVLRADPRLERLRDLVWLFVTAAGATARDGVLGSRHSRLLRSGREATPRG